MRNFPTARWAVAEAMRAYHDELNRQNQERRAQTSADRQALAKVERAIASMIAAIEDGMYQPAMKARMTELERQKSEIAARLAEAEPDLQDVNPNIAEVYRRKVSRLTEALADPHTNTEAASAIRSLIGEIVLKPMRQARRRPRSATRRADIDPRFRWRTEHAGNFRFPSYDNAAASPPNQILR